MATRPCTSSAADTEAVARHPERVVGVVAIDARGVAILAGPCAGRKRHRELVRAAGLEHAQFHRARTILLDVRPCGSIESCDLAAAEVVADRLARAVVEREDDGAGIRGVHARLQADTIYGAAPLTGCTADNEKKGGCQECSHE